LPAALAAIEFSHGLEATVQVQKNAVAFATVERASNYSVAADTARFLIPLFRGLNGHG